MSDFWLNEALDQANHHIAGLESAHRRQIEATRGFSMFDYSQLNPGIRETVRFLREEVGLETVDSGDGQTHTYDCDLPHPYVHSAIAPEDMATKSRELLHKLQVRGLSFEAPYTEEGEMIGPVINATFDPYTGTAFISLLNVSDKDLSCAVQAP